MNDDRDLRDAFARLRDSDANIVPKFAMPCAQPRRRRHMGVAVAAVLLVVALATLLVVRRPGHEPEVAPISTWRAPTDFLLKTPGSDLMTSVPKIPNIKGDRS